MIRFFLNKIPLDRVPVIQNGVGWVYGKTRSGPFEAVPIAQFDKHKPSKGYKKFTDCSHAFSSITKGYTFPKRPVKSDLQLAYDFRGNAEHVLTADRDVRVDLIRNDLGSSSFSKFHTKVGGVTYVFYAVHMVGKGKVGQIIRKGQPIATIYKWAVPHLHFYCTVNGKQKAVKDIILSAVPKAQVPKVVLPVAQPEMPVESLPVIDTTLQEENERLKAKVSALETAIGNLQAESAEKTRQFDELFARSNEVAGELNEQIDDLTVENTELKRQVELLRAGQKVKGLEAYTTTEKLDHIQDIGQTDAIVSRARALLFERAKQDIVFIVSDLIRRLKNLK